MSHITGSCVSTAVVYDPYVEALPEHFFKHHCVNDAHAAVLNLVTKP